MTYANLIDPTELEARHQARTKAALALADMIPGDAIERISVLLAAATTLIEREVGTAMAPAALTALLEPTWTTWHANGTGHVQ